MPASRTPHTDGAQAPVSGRVPLPATGAYVASYPYLSKGNTGTGKRIRTEQKTRAAEGSHNHSEYTLTLPSDCPTK